MEGSVRRIGNNVRITVQLIDARTEAHMWSEIYDKDISEIFSIQSEVAQSIARELKAVITPEVKQLIDKKPTNNMAAYDAYLMGRFYWRKITKNDIETSLKYFQLAVEKDPESALGYAGMADVWMGLQQIGAVSPEEAGPKAEAAAQKALELDSTRAEVHYTLATMEYTVKCDWERSESEFKKAIELNPNHADARAYYSHFLTFFGRNEEAMKQIEKAMELDPLNLLIRSIYGIDLIFLHRCDEALVVFQEILKVDSVHSIAHANLVNAYYCSGRYIEALKALMNDTNIPENKEIFRQALATGDFTGANRLAAEVLVKRSKTTYIRPTRIANRYAMAGDKDKAIYWLEKAYEGRDPSLVFLLMPQYDGLRDDPRFQEIARKMNLPYKLIE
jgi:tetratricopeptide (TPR) repeat protein